MYKGELKGFPKEIVEKMLERQVEQGNKRDVSVFENINTAGLETDGFDWADTSEGHGFWDDVIIDRKFNLFFEKYPKQEGQQKESTYTIKKAYPWLPDDKDLQIEHKDILYTQMSNGHGLQCNLEGQHENYPLILSKCQQIATLIREIESLNQRV